MAGIRQKNTAAELAVRRELAELGQRYRVINRDLPGSPDIANRSRQWAIFVHGCFWHRHTGCKRTTIPTRNREFWEQKFVANVARDRRAVSALRRRSYKVLVVWECQARDQAQLRTRLARWFNLATI